MQLLTDCDPRLQLKRLLCSLHKMRNINLDILRINRLFVDARASLNRDEDEVVDDLLENRPVLDTNDPETTHSLMEPEFERGNTPPKTRPRSSEELLNDGPIALRRRVEVPPQQLDLTPGELRADQGASITDHWNHSGTVEPRFLSLSNDNKIVRGMRQTR